MAYSYCSTCDCEMQESTYKQVMEGSHECIFGHINPPNITRDELILQLISRIEKLEELLGV